MTLDSEIENSIKKSKEFLIAKIEKNEIVDTWYKYDSPIPIKNTSNVLLSFFVAKALYDSKNLDENSTDILLTIIQSDLNEDIYSFIPGMYPDADDTAFAYRTLLMFEKKIKPEQILTALSKFKWKNSWKTFISDLKPREGWTVEYMDSLSTIGIHPEIHLNILCLLKEIGILSTKFSLIDLPLHFGFYKSYYYPSLFYASWLASFLMNQEELTLLQRKIFFIQNSNQLWCGIENGFSDVLESALALLIITKTKNHVKAIQSAASAICRKQQKDGSWNGGVIWKFCAPNKRMYGQDEYNILGTSVTLMALNAIVKQL